MMRPLPTTDRLAVRSGMYAAHANCHDGGGPDIVVESNPQNRISETITSLYHPKQFKVRVTLIGLLQG